MNQAARHFGKTLAFVLPVVLVLSGTLAVTRVPWVSSDSDTQLLSASSDKASQRAKPRAAQDVLRDRLLAELQEKDPGTVLDHLQKETERQPSLARHCASIARALGRAAVAKYDGAAHRAQAFSRPVCDTSFASGVAQVG